MVAVAVAIPKGAMGNQRNAAKASIKRRGRMFDIAHPAGAADTCSIYEG
jgi:hypothetical protein